MILRRPLRVSVLFLTTSALCLTLFFALVPLRRTVVSEDFEPAPSATAGDVRIDFRWPQAAPLTPAVLSWPSSGCDAGMHHETYHLEAGFDGTSQTVTWEHPSIGQPSSFEFRHERGAEVRLYPATPQRLFFVTTGRGSYTVELTDSFGERMCVARHASGDGSPLEVRAEAREDRITVYSRGQSVASVRSYDMDCRLTAARDLPATLVNPTSLAPHVVENGHKLVSPSAYFRVDDRRVELHATGSDGAEELLTFVSRESIRSFAAAAQGDVLWLVYWDDLETHLIVLDAASYGVRWMTTLDNVQPWQSPVTHVSYVDDKLSVRGGLDASPWNGGNEWVRVYDTRTGDVVQQFDVQPERMPHVGMTWTWPQSAGLEWLADWDFAPTSCFYTALGCLDRARALDIESGQLTVRVASETGSHCEAVTEVPEGLELRSEPAVGGGRNVYGRDAMALYGWSWDGNCALQGTTLLPASVLAPPAVLANTAPYFTKPMPDRLNFVSSGGRLTLRRFDSASGSYFEKTVELLGPDGGSLVTDAGERFAWMANWDAQIVRLMVFDAETLDVTFSLDLDRSSAARPVTHMGMRDRLLSVRGAIGPGGEHVVRVWDTASGAVLADAPIEASGFEP